MCEGRHTDETIFNMGFEPCAPQPGAQPYLEGPRSNRACRHSVSARSALGIAAAETGEGNLGRPAVIVAIREERICELHIRELVFRPASRPLGFGVLAHARAGGSVWSESAELVFGLGAPQCLCPCGRGRLHGRISLGNLGWRRILCAGHRHCRDGQKGRSRDYGRSGLNRGEDTRSLQFWLGHRSIQHTARCAELSAERFKHSRSTRTSRSGHSQSGIPHSYRKRQPHALSPSGERRNRVDGLPTPP